MSKLHPLFIAIQFLTRIPVPEMQKVTDEETGRSLLYYPLVGLIIGFLLLLTAWITHSASSLLSAALILSTWVLITGALHLDGLADSADAWIGGNGDKEHTLAIMKDPCSGPVAVVLLLLVLLLKFVAIEAILSHDDLLLLLLAPVVSRALMPLLLATTPYVRSNGLAASMVENLPSIKAISILLFICAAFTFFIASINIIIASIIGFFLIKSLMLKRLGGTTGDTAGAMLETMEMIIIVTLAITL